MKFKLLSAVLLAGMALFTACSSDEEVVQEVVKAGPSVEVPALSFQFGQSDTRGVASEKGGWTNFKNNVNEMQANYQVRLTLNLFAQGNLTTPIVEWQKAFAATATEGIDFVNNRITVTGLRVPAGNTYTAVAWVDFIKNDGTEVYDVQNLSEVKFVAGADVADGEDRDAYTGQRTFTMDVDGTVDAAPADGDVINIEAKRPLAKIRLVMTDYATATDWANYFAGQDANRILSGVGMQVEGLSTQFNAVTGEPSTPATAASDFYKTGVFGMFDATVAPTINWVACDEIGSAAESFEGAAPAGKLIFPVLDFNYFIPVNNDASAVYDMGFATFANTADARPAGFAFPTAVTPQDPAATAPTPWAVLSTIHLSSIPVVKNTLTTLWGNFITKALPDFVVTINDAFDNEINRVIVHDDGTTSTQIIVAGVTVDIERDADGKITSVDVDKDKEVLIAGFANWATLIEEINKLVEWTDDSKLNFYLGGGANEAYIPAADETYFTGGNPGKLGIIFESAIPAAGYAATALVNDVTVSSEVDQTAPISVTATGKEVKICSEPQATAITFGDIIIGGAKNAQIGTGKESFGAITSSTTGTTTINAANNTVAGAVLIPTGNLVIAEGSFMSTIETVVGALTIKAGTTFNGNVTSAGTLTIAGGRFQNNITIYGKGVVKINNGIYEDGVTLNADGDLTINQTKASHYFGKVSINAKANATVKAGVRADDQAYPLTMLTAGKTLTLDVAFGRIANTRGGACNVTGAAVGAGDTFPYDTTQTWCAQNVWVVQ